ASSQEGIGHYYKRKAPAGGHHRGRVWNVFRLTPHSTQGTSFFDFVTRGGVSGTKLARSSLAPGLKSPNLSTPPRSLQKADRLCSPEGAPTRRSTGPGRPWRRRRPPCRPGT